MVILGFLGPSPYDNDPDNYEYLVQFLPLMLALARKEVPYNIGPVDSEDVAHEAFIKLLLVSKRQPIGCPKAYIRKVVHSVVVDMLRKYKPQASQALPTDEDGEIQEGNLIVAASAEMDNPEIIVEQKESFDELMSGLMNAVSELPSRQKDSTVATLKDRVDDLIQFVDALQKNGIASDVQWSIDKVDRQRLQASYSPAKQKVAYRLAVDISQYK